MKIALLCPTRNRLNQYLTLVCSLLATCKIQRIELVTGIDDDDPSLQTYLRIAENLPFITPVIFKKGECRGLSDMWNILYTETPAEILGMVGDDMIFKTVGWDVEILIEFGRQPHKDNIFMVHCNDGMRGPGNTYPNVAPLAVNSFVHRDYPRLTGRYVQNVDQFIFQDTWIHETFYTLDRAKYRHDIVIKHNHFSTTGTRDAITDNLEKHREGIWDNPAVWRDKIKPVLDAEISQLRKYLS